MKYVKVIFFGPRVNSAYNIETIGGGTVLFENLISVTKKKYNVVNTNGKSNSLVKTILYNIKVSLLYITNKSQKVLFVAHRQAILFMFIDFFIRRKTVYRLIGGNFDFWFKSRFIKYILRKNAGNVTIFCELPKDVDFFQKFKVKAIIQENFRDLVKSESNSNYLKSSKKVIGFMGRVCSEKGIVEFIDLAKSCPDHDFIVVGPFQTEDDRVYVEQREKELNNLVYRGVLEHSKIDDFFNRISIFFFHSNHLGEGKPGVLVEALIRKKPVLTNYVVGCKNWDNFYNNNNIVLSKNYLSTLSNFDFSKIIFSSKELEIFSSEFCCKQIIKICK
jgi:glycosyltransferase involved in cell wall biosynthesis